MSDNATVVAYLKKKGGTVFLTLCTWAQEVIEWSEHLLVSISTRYILERQNVLADQLAMHPTRMVFPRYSRKFACRPVCNSNSHTCVSSQFWVPWLGSRLPECLLLSSIHAASKGLVAGVHVEMLIHDPCCSVVAAQSVVPWPSGYSCGKTSKEVLLICFGFIHGNYVTTCL